MTVFSELSAAVHTGNAVRLACRKLPVATAPSASRGNNTKPAHRYTATTWSTDACTDAQMPIAFTHPVVADQQTQHA
jgi:hypothetical protein